jgi:CubicO group peptidase (beta-lactamase class C family)
MGVKGFTAAGLTELRETLERKIAEGVAPGAVGLVTRGGQTEVFAVGTKALGDPAPMRRDTIFRIASMTKPVTAVAALMLIEDGVIRLDDPVDRWLPELADRRVLTRIDGPLHDTVPARRAITLEDLLTFKLGLGVLFAQDWPIVQAVQGLHGFGMPNAADPMGPDEWMARIGALPLMAQPGERWLYTVGSNLLGVLIARASGQSLPDLVQARILGPLGMTDSGFFAAPDKVARLATGYRPENGKLTLWDPPNGMYARLPAFPAGDSGLVSTADDFAAFAQFLRTGVSASGQRLISEASRQAMTVNRLTQAQMDDGRMILGPGRGWGYGLAVVIEPNADGIAPGAYGWNGGFGTTWLTDPGRDLTAILLTQRVFDNPDPPAIHKAFWAAACKALA